jgi:hypothetical protein
MGGVLTASLLEHAGALPYLLMDVGEVVLAHGLRDVRLCDYQLVGEAAGRSER